MRGLRTLHARMRCHEENAQAVVRVLTNHSAVGKVHYPGLTRHPDHRLARAQQAGYGAIISFELKGGEPEVRAFLDGLSLFTLAESLGGVESLVAHPASMTHAAMSPEARATAGITDGLLRLSIGIEAAEQTVRELAMKMLGSTLVTVQTGPEGKQVNRLYIEQGIDIATELYLSTPRIRACVPARYPSSSPETTSALAIS